MNKQLINQNPFSIFTEWYQQASEIENFEETAVALATTDANGYPAVRMVLIKEYNEAGFVFYTNLNSPKARHLTENPHAAICYHWYPIGKQVRIEGAVEPVSTEQADLYFNSRPRQSQIGAWASQQSEEMSDINQLTDNYKKYELKFLNKSVSRPDNWSGFRIIPTTIELWSQGDYRLHQRMLFEITQDKWIGKFLFP